MPKQFGHVVCLLAIVLAAFSSIGCRSTASKLASVPGMGWLDRDEEGWANFEPAPGLPRPSASSEPTTEQGKLPSSGLAGTSGSRSGTRSQFSQSDEESAIGSKPRFDTSRYAADGVLGKGSSTRTNTSSPYAGGYASAYGKYAPPKSVGGTDSTAAPQKGPYDVDPPKYAAGTKTPASYELGGKSTDLDSSKARTSGTGFVSEYAKSPYRKGATQQPTYTANSNSRLGGAASRSQVSTYTPPGFVKSRPQSVDTTPRFSNAPASPKGMVANGAAGDFSNLTNNLAPNQGAFGANSATPGQVTNQFANPAPKTNSSFLGTAASNLQQSAQNQANAAVNSFNRYTQPTGDRAPSTATRFDNAMQDAASPYANSYPSGAPQGVRVPTPATDMANQATEAANRFGTVAQEAAGQARTFVNNSSGAFNTPAQSTAPASSSLSSSSANPTPGFAAGSGSGGSGGFNAATRSPGPSSGGGSAPSGAPSSGSAYPSTATPNPFSLPISGATKSEGSAPNTNASSGAGQGLPAMQRSSAPFRPGSTSTYQGAMTVQKPLTELVSASVPSTEPADGQLALAVGDKYQFPLLLR